MSCESPSLGLKSNQNNAIVVPNVAKLAASVLALVTCRDNPNPIFLADATVAVGGSVWGNGHYDVHRTADGLSQ